MFCAKCGAQLKDDQLFCAKCGTQCKLPQVNTAPQENTMPLDMQTPVYSAPVAPAVPTPAPAYTTYGAAAKPASKGLWLKIGIPVAAVVLVAGVILIINIMSGTGFTLGKSLAGLGHETMQRLENTPLSAVTALPGVLEDGTLSVDFTYDDRWGTNYMGGVAIASNAQAGEIALYGDVSIDGEKIDLEFYMDRQRAALGSKRFDNNYYGITYATFRDDIRVFGNLIGLDRDMMDQLADLVEEIDEAMNGTVPTDEEAFDFSRYTDAFMTMYENMEETSERVEITSGGETVMVTKTELSVSKEAISICLNEIYDILIEDEYLRELFEAMDDTSMPLYDELLQEYRDMVREFDREYSESSTIVIAFYTGSNARLMRLEADIDILYGNSRERFNASADFGLSATDTWKISMTSGGDTIEVIWEYKERGNAVDNIITIDADGDFIELMSTWDMSSGDFILSYRDDYSNERLSGVYLMTDDGFTLSFDLTFGSSYSIYSDERLQLGITAERGGADIKRISYINIDVWGQDLVDRLEDFIYDMW